MKRVLFLSSHPGVDTEPLAEAWQQHPRIQLANWPIVYTYPMDLMTLTNLPHKHTTNAAIYLVGLISNENLTGRLLYKLPCCCFVYLIRRPLPTITRIVQQQLCDHKTAMDIYIIRVRRLYEMAVQTPGAVFLTWDNIKENKGLDLVQQYLHLKEPLLSCSQNLLEPDDYIPQSQVQEAEEFYERIVYRMKQIKHLKFVSQ